jgi:hypothetical protein
MLCPKCQQLVPNSSRFCNHCGAPLEEVEQGKAVGKTEEAQAPDWYLVLFDSNGNPLVSEPPEGVKRLEFGILGKQPRKWIAELRGGDKVRVLYAQGEVYHRAARPWERSDASRVRYPWTTQSEGALLLVVGHRQFRYADIRDQWVEAREREQVYVGVEDSRHSDNSGSYLGVLEVLPNSVAPR